MNGDSYSSRGMAPSSSSTKVKQGGTTTDKQASTDSGRHGSSRDYPVSIATIDVEMQSNRFSLHAMTDAATEAVIETDDAPVHQRIEANVHPAATAR
jgi:splicing factor U2AF subunit